MPNIQEKITKLLQEADRRVKKKTKPNEPVVPSAKSNHNSNGNQIIIKIGKIKIINKK